MKPLDGNGPSEKFSFKMPPTTKGGLAKLARKRGVTESYLTRLAVEFALAHPDDVVPVATTKERTRKAS